MHRGAHQLGAGPQVLWELITNKPEHSLHFHTPRGTCFFPAARPEHFNDAGMTTTQTLVWLSLLTVTWFHRIFLSKTIVTKSLHRPGTVLRPSSIPR